MRLSCGFSSLALGIFALAVACAGESNGPVCGDGVRDPNEACDDGNRDSGDACTSACQLPGTLLECVTLLEGTGSYEDEINALVALPDLSFVAGGSLQVGERHAGWIGRYDDSGTQLWLTQPPPIAEESSSVLDVVVDSGGGYWALATHGYDDHELIHLDSSGQVDTRLLLADIVQPAGLTVSAARMVLVDNYLWLAGRGGAGDVWVGRFDVEAQALSTLLIEDHAGFHDRAEAIAYNGFEVAVAATVDTGPIFDENSQVVQPHSDVLVIRFALQGQEAGRNLLGAVDPGIATVAYSIASDDHDGWIVGGLQQATGPAVFLPQKTWVSRIHPSGGTSTLTDSELPTGHAGVDDILASEREVVAVGWTYADGQLRSRLLGMGLEGMLHWAQNFNEPGYTASRTTAAVWDYANRLRTASQAWNPGETSVLRSCIVAW